MTNYYHILELSENATPTEIKVAFKRLAVIYHPDKHPHRPEMGEQFKEINEAYQILSNPYEKTRFDLKLKYQQFSQSPPTPYTYPEAPGGYRSSFHSGYYKTKIDYRKNAIATAYAFGITFLIAILIMSGVWIKKKYDNHRLQQELTERRNIFEDAKEYFDKGEHKTAFERISLLNFFRKEESDMRMFKENMIDKIIEKGNIKFRNTQYIAAIALYELVHEFQPNHPFYDTKKRLAEAYMLIGEGEKAIKIFNEFLINEYELIASLIRIAEIYRHQLKDYKKALNYYLTAHRLAVKRYKTFYGEGYPLVIKEEYVPKSHYHLYSGLAETYSSLGNHRMAIKAADWNKYVWPDSVHAYTTSAYAYIKMDDPLKACYEFSEARKRGWTGKSPILCQ